MKYHDDVYTDEVMDALRRTIKAYNRLIADPFGELPWWGSYGDSCRLCEWSNITVHSEFTGASWEEHQRCCVCPIGVPSGAFEEAPCSDEGSEYESMRRVIGVHVLCGDDYEPNNSSIRSTAVARRAWIIGKARENGIDVDALMSEGE